MDENDSTNIDTIRENIDVPQYLSDKLCMSDIELCSSITSDETNGQSMFYKNTYNVIPNPTGVYGVGMPIVYYYFEVYSIAQKPGDILSPLVIKSATASATFIKIILREERNLPVQVSRLAQ